MDPAEAELILTELTDASPKWRPASDMARPFLQLKMDEFYVASEIKYFALLSRAETDNFRSEIPWIANRLRISAESARVAVERLVRLGLFRKVGSKLRTTGKQFANSD